MRRCLPMLAATAVLLATTGWAAQPELVTSVEGIAEFRLANGMRVLLFPDQSKPTVTVNMTVFVGSRHEGYGEAGMAHLLEHMLFKGTPDHPDVPKVLKDVGANFNGTTWLDRTNYYETMPSSPANLEFAIRLEADRMVNSFVRKEDLDSEMTVVRNEFERGENDPRSVLDQRMWSVAYEWHNYGKSTIGNRADIERVPIENLRAFYKRYYRPDNAMIIVAGRFNPERALQLVQKYCGALSNPESKLRNTYTEEPAQDGERRVELRRVGELPLIGSLYHIPSGAHPDYVALDVLAEAMTSEPSGRLYKALVETKKAARIRSDAFALHDPGVIQFQADVAEGHDAEAVLAELNEVVESAAETPFTEAEIERTKRYWLKLWTLRMDDSARVAIQLSEWAAQGDWRLIFLYRDRIEKVTPQDVQRVAQTYLKTNNRTVGLFLPTNAAARVAIPATPDVKEMIGDYRGRASEVAQGEAFDVTPENIEARSERTSLPGGMKVVMLPKKTRGNSVQVDLRLRFGNEKALRGKAIAAEMLPYLMMRGTKDMSHQDIQDAFDANKASVGAGSNAGELYFTIATKRESLPEVLKVLRQILREPELPVDAMEVLKNRQLAGLEQRRNEPMALAMRALTRQTSPYGRDHVRYIPTIDEEIQRWQSVTRADVVDVYEKLLNASHGEVSIVGDFDPKDVRKQLNGMLEDWKSTVGFKRVPYITDVKLDGKRTSIETPDKENAVYLAGDVISLRDTDADYAPLMIGNYILGSGGLSSRLGDRVRQKDGLSYTIQSMLRAQAQDDRTAFLIFAITNPANMPKVEKAIREEVDRLIKDGVTEEELADAKKGFLRQQVVSRSDDGNLASTLADTAYIDRTMAHYAKLEKQISGLSVKDVNAAIRKYIKPKRIIVVVAGDFARAKSE